MKVQGGKIFFLKGNGISVGFGIYVNNWSQTNDAVSCLKTWAWDLKRALTDYNDTFTNEIDSEGTDEVGSEAISGQTDYQNSLHQRRSKLAKSDSVDIVDYRKLSRGISRATDNVNLVSRARTEIAMDFHNNREKNIERPHSIDTPVVHTTSSSSPCRTDGCMYYGSANTNFYCSRGCQNRNSDTSFSISSQNNVYNSTTTPIAKTNSKIMSDI